MPTLASRPSPSSSTLSQLESRGVPIESLLEACKACSDDCDDQDDVDPYPRGFDVDMESEMLGSFKGFSRQVVISTGKSDWDREVTEIPNSFAQLLRQESESKPPVQGEGEGSKTPSFLGNLARKFSSSVSISNSSSPSSSSPSETPTPGLNPSILTSPISAPTNLSILNSSFVSNSHSHDRESIMIFPDYKVVHEVVSNSSKHAKQVYKRYLDPSNQTRFNPSSSLSDSDSEQEEEGGSLKSWPLPYKAVILLCSHKKRDKRCSIAAPLLLNQFHHHLSSHSLIVDTSGEDLDSTTPIESLEEGGEELEKVLKQIGKESDRVGIFMVSHIGGHKFSGNVVIHFPNGTCLYYGRVTPADVGVIVDRTIINGKVIPEFLRGGLGIDGKNKGTKGILDW
ncbi:hypothetical protein JCM3765_007731 [Sporobolomyces pararoseus]